MLGGQLKFVSVSEFSGTNAKGTDYHNANITLSDGLESIELSLDLGLLHLAKSLDRGQDVEVYVNLRKKGYDFAVTVNRLHVA